MLSISELDQMGSGPHPMYKQLLLRLLLLWVATVGACPGCWGWTVNPKEVDVVPASRRNDSADWKETILESVVRVVGYYSISYCSIEMCGTDLKLSGSARRTSCVLDAVVQNAKRTD